MKHIGLFEGIGGFSLAARWMGWETIAWCEWNEFGQKVLKHHFPKATPHGDITKTDFTIYNGQCDILTGGFPCQPYSSAGKRLGKEDERHLWPEMRRAIREIEPTYIVGENVRGLLNWNGGLVFDEVCTDLENLGYQIAPCLIPAVGVNAPHKRERIWFVAYSESCRTRRLRNKEREAGTYKSNELLGGECRIPNDTGITTNPIGIGHSGRTETSRNDNAERIGRMDTESGRNGDEIRGEVDGCGGATTDTDTSRLHEQYIPSEPNESSTRCRTSYERGDFSRFPTQSPICTGDDGLSSRLDNITFSKWRNESIKAAGNAIVPQVAYQIFKAIEQLDKKFNQ
jgi:DNA (cytosine-5)-methyltransferase 1